jgi:hypothetical protein
MGSLADVWEARQRADREADYWLGVYKEAQTDVLKILDGEGSDADKIARLRSWAQE